MEHLGNFFKKCKILLYVLFVTCSFTFFTFVEFTTTYKEPDFFYVAPVRRFEFRGSTIAREEWIAAVSIREPTVFYFSAFVNFDRILVISIVERRNVTNETRCSFFNHDGSIITQPTKGEIYLLPDYRKLRFTSSFVHCKILGKEVPYAVALTPEIVNHSRTYVPIIKHKDQIIRNFTVCISPLFNNFKDGNAIVEMIELNKILGAQYFMFYNYSISRDVNLILEHYRDLGLVEIIQWHLPAKIRISGPEEIHYFAQFSALNDCLYRNKRVSRYVVVQDVDEFIIPRNHHTWGDLLASLPSNYSTYLVRSSLFRKDWPDLNETYLSKSDLASAKKYKSLTILKQFRETKTFPKEQRTKYIARTDCVEAMDIHYVWSHRPKKNCAHYYVDESIALTHHYRGPLFIHKAKILDKRINYFKAKLLDSLNKTWTILRNGPLAVNERTNITENGKDNKRKGM